MGFQKCKDEQKNAFALCATEVDSMRLEYAELCLVKDCKGAPPLGNTVLY